MPRRTSRGPGRSPAAVERGFPSTVPAVVEAMSEPELPWSGTHATGEWDITVPAYLDTRERYVDARGF